MIVIEIRFGRDLPASASRAGSALSAKASPERADRVVRIAPGNGAGGWFAAACGFVAAILLSLVIERTGLEAQALASVRSVPYLPVQSAAAPPSVAQRAAQLIEEAERSVAARPDPLAALPSVVDDDVARLEDAAIASSSAVAEFAPVADEELGWLDAAIRRDVSRLAADVAGAPEISAVTDLDPAASEAVGSASRDARAAFAPAGDPAEQSDALGDDGAKPLLQIVRSSASEEEELDRQMRSVAQQGRWDEVAALHMALPASAVLLVAKWDARIALSQHNPLVAVAALDAVTDVLDDEARRLQAAALLASGAQERAVAAYRALLAAAPDDARLWLGLGLALRGTTAAGNALAQTAATAADDIAASNENVTDTRDESNAGEHSVHDAASAYALEQSVQLAAEPELRAAASAQRRSTGG